MESVSYRLQYLDKDVIRILDGIVDCAELEIRYIQTF